jgi:hypothetical protein
VRETGKTACRTQFGELRLGRLTKESKPMPRSLLSIIGLAALAVAAGVSTSPSPATADTIFDVEHARATLRAGRPISDHDAEYLNRWGALSDGYSPRRRYYEDPDYEPFFYVERRSHRTRYYRSRR